MTLEEFQHRQIDHTGFRIVRSALPDRLLEMLLASAEQIYAKLGDAKWNGRSPETCGAKSYRPTASSLLLESIVSEVELRQLLSSLGATVTAFVSGEIVCNLDQAWLRRQYPAILAPPDHHPHGWHQDGALAFDFLANPDGGASDALLPMLTAWIPLTDCGIDAPGLELIAGRPMRLFGLRELDDALLRSKFPAEVFIAPKLSAGDAVFMWGDVPHRTHVTADMTGIRTSIEFRFLAADDIPRRISTQRFLRC